MRGRASDLETPLSLQRQVDIAEHRRPRHQRRFLEHEADIALGLAAAVELARGPVDLATAGLPEAGDDAERRRLAAARWAEQRQELPSLHVERHVLEGEGAVREQL